MEKGRDFIYNNRKRFLIGGMVGIVLILVVSLIFVMVGNLNSVTLNVMVAPQKATVLINGTKYDTKGEYKIRPGEYTAEISAEGFVSKTATFTAADGGTANLWLYLEPENGNNDWCYDDPVDGLIVGAIRNNYTLEATRKLKEDNPILGKLPVKVDYFTEDYGSRVWYMVSYEMTPEKTGFIITIDDYSGGNRERALDKIRELGFSPEDFEISYRDKSVLYRSFKAY